MRFPGFVGPGYTLRSLAMECQNCVNLYPEIDELGTAANGERGFLVGTPGLRKVLTLPTSPVRALYRASDDKVYAVAGSTVYIVSPASWSYVPIGTLYTSTGPVGVADNGNQVCFVDGPNGYIYTVNSSTFQQITSPNWQGADRVFFLDGYFIFNKPNTQQFYITQIYDGFTIDALDFASAEGSPDLLITLVADHRELWLFGTQTVEIWYNSGNPDFPFQRIQGAYIEFGCAAPYSAQKLENRVYWLSDGLNGGGIVYEAVGYQPQRISNFAVENSLIGADLSTATAFAYQEQGHFFYALNVPAIGTTWVYDSTIGQWHERKYYNNGILERGRPDTHVYANGQHIVGDYADGRIYVYDDNYYTDDTAPIIRERTSPHLSDGLKRTFYTSFELDAQLGVGLSTGQGSNPQVMLQWSDDKGFTWSNEHWTSLGAIGSRYNRARWTRMGNSRDRVYRLRMSDPVRPIFRGVELGIVQGAY